ncbi:hypothetical protein HPB52_024581 [Rhipicephalus sanguineus]|uniref:Uncharacterized protein n=1 Tax=Rhipicephalus sanguineus TaxID=34632 RepID=A0A9D4PC07_RHISA|nr:hypothetical protein HPB52_024581 [Rhipicephalus sanguineus]
MPQRTKVEKNESSSESDWEEVPEGADLDSYAPVVPENGITITLKEPVMTGKRKKAKFDPEVAEMRRRINRVRKEVHVLKHKVHLLCLLAHGLKLNSLMLDQTLHGVIEARFCMSLYPVPLDAVQLLKTDVKPGRKAPEGNPEIKAPSKKKAQRVPSESDEVDSDFEVAKPKKAPGKKKRFKNHPLYALKRHLLKFEAIYPPDAPTLGFVRGEPVYARECIHTLRSRETWLREARMVRIKEQPYKIVKARPKYDKFSGQILKEQPLELFGHWQTEPYMPPIAFNGKVPRNEWGNVELFKSCMLPVGTVHLRAPGLARVASKLNIDCVPAVVGFEGHCRGVHPVAALGKLILSGAGKVEA